MTLKSALDDVLKTTLAAVSGIIGKLEYIAGLRDGNKKYTHWGLQRLHGEEATQQALAEAHRLFFLNILRAPLRMLKEDLKQSSDAQQAAPHEYAESLRTRWRFGAAFQFSATRSFESGFESGKDSTGRQSPSLSAIPTTWPITSASCGCRKTLTCTGESGCGCSTR